MKVQWQVTSFVNTSSVMVYFVLKLLMAVALSAVHVS